MITSYLRLFDGLTSRISDLCRRHLSGSGPAGTLESRVAMARGLAQKPEDGGSGDRQVAEEVGGAAERDHDPQPMFPAVVAPAKRLEEAVRAVQEVEREEADGDDVEDGDDAVLEAEDDHAPDIGNLRARLHHRHAKDVVVALHRVGGQVRLEGPGLG